MLSLGLSVEYTGLIMDGRLQFHEYKILKSNGKDVLFMTTIIRHTSILAGAISLLNAFEINHTKGFSLYSSLALGSFLGLSLVNKNVTGVPSMGYPLFTSFLKDIEFNAKLVSEKNKTLSINLRTNSLDKLRGTQNSITFPSNYVNPNNILYTDVNLNGRGFYLHHVYSILDIHRNCFRVQLILHLMN